jgi:hypothetical protein
MEQIARRSSRNDETDFDELPLIPIPRREPATSAVAAPLIGPLPQDRRRVEHDDDSDSDLATAAHPVVASEPPTLTERDRQILAFEKQWWRHAGAKEQAIREQF